MVTNLYHFFYNGVFPSNTAIDEGIKRASPCMDSADKLFVEAQKLINA